MQYADYTMSSPNSVCSHEANLWFMGHPDLTGGVSDSSARDRISSPQPPKLTVLMQYERSFYHFIT
jgi:hypothetical protein